VREKIISLCAAVIAERITGIKLQMEELVRDAANDSKSTAGDKHETSRAMMQLEQEKLGSQLRILEEQQQQLALISQLQQSPKIINGSLIETDRGNIFIGVALGKLNAGGQDVICITNQSPLGKLLTGKSSGESVSLNTIKYTILSVQ
jgi:transcription elongation GreA/GreB family factor